MKWFILLICSCMLLLTSFVYANAVPDAGKSNVITVDESALRVDQAEVEIPVFDEKGFNPCEVVSLVPLQLLSPMGWKMLSLCNKLFPDGLPGKRFLPFSKDEFAETDFAEEQENGSSGTVPLPWKSPSGSSYDDYMRKLDREKTLSHGKVCL